MLSYPGFANITVHVFLVRHLWAKKTCQHVQYFILAGAWKWQRSVAARYYPYPIAFNMQALPWFMCMFMLVFAPSVISCAWQPLRHTLRKSKVKLTLSPGDHKNSVLPKHLFLCLGLQFPVMCSRFLWLPTFILLPVIFFLLSSFLSIVVFSNQLSLLKMSTKSMLAELAMYP